MNDKVWPKTHFRRGTKGDREPPMSLRWNQWSLVGFLGVTTPMMTELFLAETPVVAPLLEYQGVSERLWRVNVSMNEFFFHF